MINYLINNTQRYKKDQTFCYLSFVDCGSINAVKNWMHKSRFLQNYELIYVKEGTLHLNVGDTSITLNSDNMIIIPPYKTISGSKISEDKTSFYWVDFITNRPDIFDITIEPVKLNRPVKILDAFEELIGFSKQKNIRDFIKDSYLLILLHEIKKYHNDSSKQVVVTKTCNYIELNISKPLTTEMVADALNYNKDYLARIFKEHHGILLNDYIVMQKINLSKRLLTTSNYKIKEISEFLGYDDSNLFTKFFKYHVKMSPVQYRNNHS